jgi:hypothetical protein
MKKDEVYWNPQTEKLEVCPFDPDDARFEWHDTSISC